MHYRVQNEGAKWLKFVLHNLKSCDILSKCVDDIQHHDSGYPVSGCSDPDLVYCGLQIELNGGFYNDF